MKKTSSSTGLQECSCLSHCLHTINSLLRLKVFPVLCAVEATPNPSQRPGV